MVRDAIDKKWISLAKRNERIPPTSIHAGTNEEGSYTASGYLPIDMLCHHPTANRQNRIERFSAWNKVSGFEGPQCPCRQRGQTVAHILISCRNFREAIERMWTTEWEYRFGIHHKSRKVLGLRVLLTVPKYAVNPAKFILKTELLAQFSSNYPVQ